MATVILSTVGRIFGGPIGGAVGAIAGNFVDQKIFGSGKVTEGPRIKELDIQTSSYGTSISSIFGQMRVAGTVFWSTDLIETRTKQGGGKGRPSTNVYSYSVNFAVALSSRPLSSIGRIWADGNLLRGASGDFKVGTEFRFYDGMGDQLPDPIIESALGQEQCPAHRGFAYAVFENFQLADFGNRIPQLTFEVYERDGNVSISDIFFDTSDGVITGQSSETLVGYTFDGDSVKAALTPLLNFCPITILPEGSGFVLKDISSQQEAKVAEPVSIENGENAGAFQETIQRGAQIPGQLSCRYYEPARDFQLGLQSSLRPGAGNAALEIDFPAALEAAAVKRFADIKLLDLQKARIGMEGVALAGKEIFGPGDIITISDRPIKFRITETEYFEGYQKLSGRRSVGAFDIAEVPASPGVGNPASDVSAGTTIIEILDLPVISGSNPNNAAVVIAATGSEPGWRGAALYQRQGNHLTELGVINVPATMGQLTQELPGHDALLVDDANIIEVQLPHDNALFPPGSGDPLSVDAPVLCVGDELIRYGSAIEIEGNKWQMQGLLRGCFGTPELVENHPVGTNVVLLEKETLYPIDVDQSPIGDSLIVEASGLGDDVPAVANRQIRKLALVPRSPVHGKVEVAEIGDLQISWIRRSRVDLGWRDYVELPIGEDNELYNIEFFADHSSVGVRQSSVPELRVSSADLAAWGLPSNAVVDIHIRQMGRYDRSEPLVLSIIL